MENVFVVALAIVVGVGMVGIAAGLTWIVQQSWAWFLRRRQYAGMPERIRRINTVC